MQLEDGAQSGESLFVCALLLGCLSCLSINFVSKAEWCKQSEASGESGRVRERKKEKERKKRCTISRQLITRIEAATNQPKHVKSKQWKL